ncbi:hypothetical protein KQX54_013281 [Cotesia glomerata]|uniref:Thioredoxin domain-containing protein n=1 Tax=Cotesia glomerata TaxID=32391 RepID=A0AAV7J674_COTGL|nr:hypothetical protein KQX54_013281 [Cotesia glomerata]
MECAIDLVVHKIDGIRVNVKEYCIIPIVNKQLKKTIHGVVYPIYKWDDLSKCSQGRYEFIKRNYEIEYGEGNCNLIEALQTIKEYLMTAKKVYVKNPIIGKFLSDYFTPKAKIVSLESFGINNLDMISKNPQHYCSYHNNLGTRLTRRYRIKSGVPTLILLEGASGSVVTRGGVERVTEDPNGINFPWRPPHPKATLEDGPLLACGARDTKEPMLHEELRHCIKGVYFSAHWCPPCRAFTPQLVDTYQRIRERGHHFEVIFISSDRSEESYNVHIESMPWLRIPFTHEERRKKLAIALDVQAIPTLVILDPRDNIITLEGRAELLEDPEGLNFPWTTRLVNILTEKYATSLHDAPAIILFVASEGEDCEIQFGESVLLPAAETYRRDRPDYDPNYDDPDDTLQFYIALDCETSDILREFVGLDDAVPLLTAIDIPRGVYAVMEDGAEITVDSVQLFVDGFRNNKLPINKIAASQKSVNNEKISS